MGSGRPTRGSSRSTDDSSYGTELHNWRACPVTRRVILVNPRVCPPRSARLPLSLLALGAALEGRWEFDIIDGNIDPDAIFRIESLLGSSDVALVAVTVMPGPQVARAIQISSMVRRHAPNVPIAWGGYFPTLYPDSAVNAPYVDFVIRGQGEDTLLELLDRLPDAGPPVAVGLAAETSSVSSPESMAKIRGLTWKRSGQIVHNTDRPFRPPDAYPPYPYDRLGDVGRYLRPSFLGSRTAVHQAAIGCRYRCSFCGVVSMFNGHTDLPGTAPPDGRSDDATRQVRSERRSILRSQLLRPRRDQR